MGKKSSIEWTHHTFNPWWGCVKVSAGCKNCYAEKWAKRIGLDVWGGNSDRRFFGDAHWRDPIRWNAEASAAGERHRVFCASMADVFEARSELDPWRERLWNLIEATPALDWLLLTKRPQQIPSKVPWGDRWPTNVWLGTTAENQVWADHRIPVLLKYPAVVRFVSCEPLIGPLDLTPWLSGRDKRAIDWVIAGGESGARARPMNPEWAFSLRNQCTTAGVPFHFKQWGHWCPETESMPRSARRQFVVASDGSMIPLVRLGKHASGRRLGNEIWDQFPSPNLARRRHPAMFFL